MAAVPGITRIPNYQTPKRIPASEIEIALIAFAVLVALGVALAMLWNRWNAGRQTET
jgi:hypothetical protein